MKFCTNGHVSLDVSQETSYSVTCATCNFVQHDTWQYGHVSETFVQYDTSLSWTCQKTFVQSETCYWNFLHYDTCDMKFCKVRQLSIFTRVAGNYVQWNICPRSILYRRTRGNGIFIQSEACHEKFCKVWHVAILTCETKFCTVEDRTQGILYSATGVTRSVVQFDTCHRKFRTVWHLSHIIYTVRHVSLQFFTVRNVYI